MKSLNKVEPLPQTSAASARRESIRSQIVVVEEEGSCNSIGVCDNILIAFSFLIVLVTFPVSVWCCLKIVQEYERAVIFRLGRVRQGGAKGPGIFWIIPCIDSFRRVDLRTMSFDIPSQEVLSSDSVTVIIDAILYYRVINASATVIRVENAHRATQMLAHTTLRRVVGSKTLSQIIIQRDEMTNEMEKALFETTREWGIKVERMEIKDVKIPPHLQRAMASEAEAVRVARAKALTAEGEIKASCYLRDAADVIASSPIALHLRYLQTLSLIAAEKNSTIIFPVPLEFLTAIVKYSETYVNRTPFGR
ncbi:band 7 protein AGAP004871-like [Latimeria chalumnae]